MEPLYLTTFDPPQLMNDSPPRFENENKRAVMRAVCPEDSQHASTIVYARYPPSRAPFIIPGASRTKFEHREDLFQYEPDDEAINWYLNFANADLFCMYGSRAFAQDELQVLEHPALGAVREALMPTRENLQTMQGEEPTPITIAGVERRCRFDSTRFYGVKFAEGDPKEVAAAAAPINPPTISNILAIEAPSGGSGTYTVEQLNRILVIAYSGFRAAIHESRRQRAAASPRVNIHTGFWGCGAYGGNRVVMTLLQIIAAWLVGIDRLVFHVVDRAGTTAYEGAMTLFQGQVLRRQGVIRRLLGLSGASCRLDEVIATIASKGFLWGTSDGN